MSCIRDNCKKLIWLDTADSTGTCLFDVLPYVDVYFKKQYLKDIMRYTEPIWGGRTYAEYYHELLGIDDEVMENSKFPIADPQYLSKIKLSWNVGLADLFGRKVRLLANPFNLTVPDFVSPDVDRHFDVHFRGGGQTPICGYQRSKCRELVNELTYLSHPDVNTRVPYKEYVNEIKASKAVLSPFGWGEICTRDFEAMAFGATLLKHSMEHCITYPNWYVPNETYIPISWDFHDFDSIMSNIGSAEYRKIAKNGQELYRYYRTNPHAKIEFAEHVIQQAHEND